MRSATASTSTARFPPERPASKLVNRNLSDIAAMGGTPDRAILCLLFGPDLAYAWLRDFVLGAGAAAEKEGLRIVGGDISRLEKGVLHLHC